MAWIGLLPVLAGIAAVVWKARQYRKVVLWSFLIAILLQSFSYLFFSGIVAGSIVVPWIIAGLVGGVILGKRTTLGKQDNLLYYKQNLIFSLSYLVLLLFNQFVAAALHAYIPFLLYIAGTAAGVQAGFLGMLLYRDFSSKRVPKIKAPKTPKAPKAPKAPKEAKKQNKIQALKALKKTKKSGPAVVAIILCLSCLCPIGTVDAAAEKTAAEAPATPAAASDMDIVPAEIALTGIAEGNKTAYDNTAGGNIGISLIADKGSMGDSENGRAFEGGGVRYFNYYRVAPDAGSKYQFGIDGSSVRVYYGFEIYNKKNTKQITALLDQDIADRKANGYNVDSYQTGGATAYRIHEEAGVIMGVTYMTAMENTLFTMIYTYAAPSKQPADGAVMKLPAKMTGQQLDSLFTAWTGRVLASKEFKTELTGVEGTKAKAAKAASEEGLKKKSGSSGSAGGGVMNLFTNGKNLMKPIPIKPQQVMLADLLCGLLAGGGMSAFALLGLMPKETEPPREQEPEKEEPFGASKVPGIGMRRKDGKYWTKNHSWQDEGAPGLQLEKLQRILSNLEEELLKYLQAEDQMMANVVRIEKRRCERERTAWEEDYKTINRKNFEYTEIHRPKEKESSEKPAEESKKEAETTAAILPEEEKQRVWNFEGDLGVIANFGDFEKLAEQKSPAASLNVTMAVLRRISAGAPPEEGVHILQEPVTGEILRETGVEEVLNEEIIKSVGVLANVERKAMNFDKTGMEMIPASLKAMTESAEDLIERNKKKAVKK